MNANTTTPTSHTDHELTQRIRSFLASRSMPGLRGLEVNVDGGRVTISGEVQTYYEKQIATCCCQRVAGVHEVINDVQVLPREMFSTTVTASARSPFNRPSRQAK